jgi:hypothetical protein
MFIHRQNSFGFARGVLPKLCCIALTKAFDRVMERLHIAWPITFSARWFDKSRASSLFGDD